MKFDLWEGFDIPNKTTEPISDINNDIKNIKNFLEVIKMDNNNDNHNKITKIQNLYDDLNNILNLPIKSDDLNSKIKKLAEIIILSDIDSNSDSNISSSNKTYKTDLITFTTLAEGIISVENTQSDELEDGVSKLFANLDFKNPEVLYYIFFFAIVALIFALLKENILNSTSIVIIIIVIFSLMMLMGNDKYKNLLINYCSKTINKNEPICQNYKKISVTSK